MKQSVSAKLFLTVATTGGIQILGLLSGILLARAMGASGRGELATIILWPSIIVYLGDLGGPNAYVFKSSESPTSVSRLIGNILPITIAQSALLYVVGIPATWGLTQGNKSVQILSILFLLIYVPLNLATRYLNAINQGLENFRYFNAVRIGVQATYALGVAALWLLESVSVESVLLITMLSNIFALAVAYVGVLSQVRGLWTPDIGLGQETFIYGAKSHLGSLTPVDSMRLDLALIAGLLGSYEVGLYTVATSSANIIRAIGTSISSVAFPSVAAAKQTDSRTDITHRMIRLAVLLTAVMAGGLVVTSEWLVPLVYGEGFSEAVPVVQVLAVGMIPAVLRHVLSACLRGANSPVSGSVAEVISWAALVVAIPVLLPLFGLTGISAAVGLSYLTSLAACVWLGRDTLPISLAHVVPRWSDLVFATTYVRKLNLWKRA